MFLLWTSWFSLCPLDPWPIPLPDWLRRLGFGVCSLGLVLAIGALVQLRGLENVKHLVTGGLFARIRHPMYAVWAGRCTTGLWPVSWLGWSASAPFSIGSGWRSRRWSHGTGRPTEPTGSAPGFDHGPRANGQRYSVDPNGSTWIRGVRPDRFRHSSLFDANLLQLTCIIW
jgi:hypothetical protein